MAVNINIPKPIIDYNDLENKPTLVTEHSELTLDDGTNPHGTTKADVGLSNVPNLDTTDAVNKAHDAVTLDGAPNYLTIIGQAITRGLINLASHVTGRLPFSNLETGTARSVIGRSGSGNGDVNNISAGNDTILSRSGSGDVSFNNANTVKTILSLQNVDNTSDLSKPISTATQTALDLATFTIELIDELSVDFYAPADLKINTTTVISGSGTVSLQVNDSAYTLGTLINQGDKITISVNTASVVNLNSKYE
jgi:autotransporter-associated beta strand protein